MGQDKKEAKLREVRFLSALYIYIYVCIYR